MKKIIVTIITIMMMVSLVSCKTVEHSITKSISNSDPTTVTVWEKENDEVVKKYDVTFETIEEAEAFLFD